MLPYWAEWAICDIRPSDIDDWIAVLAARDGNLLRSGFVRVVLGKSAKRAGFAGRRVTWLNFRHTAASLMFDAGLTIFEVQQRLGHRSPTMTAEVDTHLMRERYEEGREKMEDYMRAKRFRPANDDGQSSSGA